MKETVSEKKPNIFVRAWKRLVKFCRDTVGELKKVVWTPKHEVIKSSKLVILAVAIICVSIAIIDLCFSWVFNSLAGLIG